MLWFIKTSLENDDDLFIQEESSVLNEERLNLDEGEVVYRKIPNPIIYRFSEDCKDTPRDNVAANITGVLVSEKLRRVLDNLQVDNVQYFKTQLINVGCDIDYGGYYFANIVGKYNLIDRSRSELRLDPDDGSIEDIDSLVLQDLNEDDYPSVFRLKEMPMIVVVKDVIKKEFEREKITGVRFF